MSAATATRVPEPQSGPLTHKQIMTIISGLMLGMFLASLDQMIVSTAIRTIGDELHGLSMQAWVTTAFLITSTITTPLYGKVSDIYGRKPLFLFAITVFIVGSALCGLAQSMYMLAAFRAFQGLGAGGLMSLALAIIGDIIAPRQRAKYQGYFMAVFATSSVLGPVLGGFFAGQSTILGITGWRWIFYINVPVGIIALVVVTKVLHIHHERREHRIDWWGALALVIGLVPLLLVAEQGQTWGWASGAAFTCYLIGLAGLVAFVRVEAKMGAEALLPLRLFRNGVFATGSAQSLVIGIGMFGGITSIPLYLQIVKGASPTEAGLLLLPMVAGIMSASLSSGLFTAKTGRYKIFPVMGCTAIIIALLLLSTVGADTPLWRTDLYMLLFGMGLGMNMQAVVLAMQNAVPPRDMGVATSSTTFFRQTGGTLGAAIFISILFSAAAGKIRTAYEKAAGTEEFQQAAAAHPKQAASIGHGGNLNDTQFLAHLDKALAHPFRVGFSQSMDLVFLVGAGVLAIALVLSLMMKEVPLRSESGIEAARSEAAAAAAAAADAADATEPTAPPSSQVDGAVRGRQPESTPPPRRT